MKNSTEEAFSQAMDIRTAMATGEISPEEGNKLLFRWLGTQTPARIGRIGTAAYRAGYPDLAYAFWEVAKERGATFSGTIDAAFSIVTEGDWQEPLV